MQFFNDQTDVVYHNKLFIKFTTAFIMMIFLNDGIYFKLMGSKITEKLAWN
jgi:hypothetical protein